ncbi:transposase [Microbispora sp. NEAU-D428]|nr:transposase [Microbispora sitophila]
MHDAGWAQFVTMLEYKARLFRPIFHRIDRWFVSSKLCSECGALAGSMPPAQCEEAGALAGERVKRR